jgi:hypothetical protein
MPESKGEFYGKRSKIPKRNADKRRGKEINAD